MEDRDIEKVQDSADFAAKLRRLADSLDTGERFRLQVAGVRLSVPRTAEISIEHEVTDGSHELEFQLKWSTADDDN